MEKQEQQEIYTEFNSLVNMAPAELEKWLTTEQSKAVGWDSGDGESVGHKSGEKIIAIKRKKKESLTDADYKHMQKVVGYIRRHKAQKPSGELSESNWHYSLKNWGYDYTKK
jgi:Protein of unknown function (DUF3140)